MNRRTAVTAAGITLLAGCWLYYRRWLNENPYAEAGLYEEWSYGATSSCPSVELWADFCGQRIKCPVIFGGLNNPDLRYYDYDGDGRRDIVFEDDRYKQVVAFFPARGEASPEFIVIRNDVTWP